ncbi:hypothetical protein ACGFLS_30685 [Streptomyces abikoensis]|uniref:hypothetical protein n=1 Tax=Streptomyces abikoensis TaxID=97398 RepID=UPI003713D652
MNDIQRWLDESRSRTFCVIGKGKCAHLSRGNDESLCGKLMLDGSRYVGAQDVPDYAPCRTCWKIMERESAELEKGRDAVASEGRYKVSLTRPVMEFLDGTSCMQGDEEPEIRAELLALSRRVNGTEVGWVSFETLGWLCDYIRTWAEGMEDDADPGEQRAAFAALKKIGAIYAQAKEEGAAAVAETQGKLKLSEVRGDIRVGSVNGSGGTIHAIKDIDANGRNVPYCSIKSKNMLRSWGPAHEQKATLELCAQCSKHVPTGAVEITEETVAIPGLDRTVTRRVAKPATGDDNTNNANGEDPAMAAKTSGTMTKATQNEVSEAIRANIARLASMDGEGTAEGAEALREEIRKATEGITGRGAAGIKATLRAEADKAMETATAATKPDAEEKSDAEEEPGAEVVSLATKSVEEIADFAKLVEIGAQRVREAATESFEKGRAVGEVQHAMRLGSTDKDGDPDLNARQDITKKGAGRIYELVLANLPEEGADPDADVIRERIGTIQTDARRAMQTIQPEYVRSLDVEPDPKAEDYEEQKATLEAHRARFHNALKMFPADFMVDDEEDGKPVKRPIKWSERIFDYYEKKGKPLRRYTRAEEAAQKRAIKRSQKAQLEAAVEAGEITQEEADATLNPGATPEEVKEKADKRAKSAFLRLVDEAKKLESEEEKTARLDELASLLADFRKELKKAEKADA